MIIVHDSDVCLESGPRGAVMLAEQSQLHVMKREPEGEELYRDALIEEAQARSKKPSKLSRPRKKYVYEQANGNPKAHPSIFVRLRRSKKPTRLTLTDTIRYIDDAFKYGMSLMLNWFLPQL